MGERDFPIRDGKHPLDCSNSSDRALALLRSPGTSAAEDREAALTLADRTYLLHGEISDAAVNDCRTLLEMCGLLPYDAQPRTNFMSKPVTTGYRRP